MNKLLIPFLFCLLLISACKKRPNRIDWDLMEESRLDIKEVDFEYFTAKSKIKFQDSESNISATANIRIKKDSIIWFSIIPALGIEAARGIITQDSIIILNRLEKQYIAHDFKSLSESFNFEISYPILQAMLLGNMPFPMEATDLVERSEKYYLVKQAEGQLKVENYISTRTMKLEKVDMLERKSKNTFSLFYGDFQLLDVYAIPYSSVVSINTQSAKGAAKKTRLEIDHTKAELSDNPLNFSFNIPQKYERK